MKTRRELLQAMIVSLGGASMLSACSGAASIIPSQASAETLRFYQPSELTLVARLSDLIIPRTDTPGALDVNVPGFLDALMADWASAETQLAHRGALLAISDSLGRDFADQTDSKAVAGLTQLDASAYAGRGGHKGYRSVKGLITQAYFASEEGALLEAKWVATPGRWDPCLDIG
ncbi:MAG: gluconate 2-dehydrogenase gamma chain [Pseudohongiellaceae bacterium]|jgi:gluconate 2-dehydrogenase gamma chain